MTATFQTYITRDHSISSVLLNVYKRIYLFITPVKIKNFARLTRQSEKGMNPVIYLNKTFISEQPYCKLILKNETRELKERLVNCKVLSRDPSSNHYIMPCSDHNIRLLTDQMSDIALVNTRYLHGKAIKTVPVSIDRHQSTVIYKHQYRPGITLRPLQHDNKLFVVMTITVNLRNKINNILAPKERDN